MAYKRQTRIPITIPTCSANFLKMIGTLLLSLYLFGQSIIQNGLLNSYYMTTQQLYELTGENYTAFMATGTASVCLLVGSVGIPMISFLLVEGINKTSNVKRYILSVLAAAVVTEVPYDYAVSGNFFNFGEQCFLWTILIALIMLALMKVFQGKGALAVTINIMIMIGGCIWAFFFKSKFGAAFVLITAILYLLRGHKALSMFLGILVSLTYITAPLGFIAVGLYNGERKNLEYKSCKYGYYVYCPVITLIFALIANILLTPIS